MKYGKLLFHVWCHSHKSRWAQAPAIAPALAFIFFWCHTLVLHFSPYHSDTSLLRISKFTFTSKCAVTFTVYIQAFTVFSQGWCSLPTHHRPHQTAPLTRGKYNVNKAYLWVSVNRPQFQEPELSSNFIVATSDVWASFGAAELVTGAALLSAAWLLVWREKEEILKLQWAPELLATETSGFKEYWRETHSHPQILHSKSFCLLHSVYAFKQALFPSKNKPIYEQNICLY